MDPENSSSFSQKLLTIPYHVTHEFIPRDNLDYF
jgi:hypothetical protein